MCDCLNSIEQLIKNRAKELFNLDVTKVAAKYEIKIQLKLKNGMEDSFSVPLDKCPLCNQKYNS